MIIWESYSDEQRQKLLDTLNVSRSKQDLVSNILYKEFAAFTDNDWRFLRSVGIVNGVWPGYFFKALRFLISIVFFAVDYKRHDVNYFIGGTEEDRKTADDGLLKYSVLTLFEVLKKLRFTSYIFINFILAAIYIPLAILYLAATTPFLIIVLFSYIMVRGFWFKNSFNFITK